MHVFFNVFVLSRFYLLASREFSKSSLTTLTGRWTTSPAAIRSTTSLGSAWIAATSVIVFLVLWREKADDFGATSAWMVRRTDSRSLWRETGSLVIATEMEGYHPLCSFTAYLWLVSNEATTTKLLPSTSKLIWTQIEGLIHFTFWFNKETATTSHHKTIFPRLHSSWKLKST